MLERYQAIYLSPHLDDAALSCGGQIFWQTRENSPVLIVTPMAGEPPADLRPSDFVKELHQRWELVQDAVQVRQAEDAAACHILGADFLHWPVPDCVYRTDPATGGPCYPTWESVITTMHPADEAVVDFLARKLHQLPAAEQVYAPLSAGNHVDHRLTRLAAERVFGEALIYYEDFPYAEKPGAVTAVLAATPGHWHSATIPLTVDDVRAKVDAIWAYASQRSTFFTSRDDLVKKINAYTEHVGGERQWRIKNDD